MASLEELGYIHIRIFTAARMVQPVVGKINGRRIPLGPYHVAQIFVFVFPLVIAYIVAKIFALPMLITVGVAVAFGALLVVALAPLVRVESVPFTHQLDRTLRLIFFRRPIIIGEPDDIVRFEKHVRDLHRERRASEDDDRSDDE